MHGPPHLHLPSMSSFHSDRPPESHLRGHAHRKEPHPNRTIFNPPGLPIPRQLHGNTTLCKHYTFTAAPHSLSKQKPCAPLRTTQGRAAAPRYLLSGATRAEGAALHTGANIAGHAVQVRGASEHRGNEHGGRHAQSFDLLPTESTIGETREGGRGERTIPSGRPGQTAGGRRGSSRDALHGTDVKGGNKYIYLLSLLSSF